jgi:LDH2 family malate/lactate/ureidoglycolate dehydrogenase
MKVKLADLEAITHAAILKYMYSETEASIIQKILMYAQLRGNNQGVVKLIGKGIPKREGASAPKLVKETPVSALVKGNKTHAMIVMNYLADLAIKKAKKSGVGITGNFDSSESTGALGFYVNKIAEQGLIGLAFASAPFQTTAPHGSTEAKFCTNPLAYGIPTKSDPIILDMSTSAMAYYGLIEAKTAGRNVPKGTGYDSKGRETTDPAEIMSGALKTFGGHKGSGLALIVQILAGVFVNADSFDNDSDNAGNLVIAIDPNIFTETNEFKTKVSEIISKVKSAKKINGVEEIFIPGERGNKLRKKVVTSAEIEIEENLLNSLKAVTAD